MDVMEIIDEIENNNHPIQDGLDYFMDCFVTVNKVRTRCDRVSIIQCDMKGKLGRTGIQTLLELRRGDWITWVLLDEVECLEVEEFNK